MKYQVDLNSDLGESFGAYKLGQDDLIMDYITSANIACGYHAGDHNVMNHAVKTAVAKKVAIGAHPGLDDLIGFGRRVMQVDAKDIYHSVIYQIGALANFAKIHQSNLHHVKPHGALFNMASTDATLAAAIAEAVYDSDPKLVLYGLSGGELTKAGKRLGLTVAEEVFADRTYQADGTLTNRTEANAMIKDPNEAVERVLRMVTEGKVRTVTGTDLDIQADTICIHGDEASSLLFAKTLREQLMKHHVVIKKVGAKK